MGTILTGERVIEAVERVRPSIHVMFADKRAVWRPPYIAFVVDGPGLIQPVTGYIGNPVYKKDWDPKWGKYKHSSIFTNIARRKCEAARRNGEPTSVTIALRPEKFEKGEYLYPGGVAEEKDGIGVGVSGLYGYVDEWMAWWIYHAVVTLCQQEATARIAGDKKRI